MHLSGPAQGADRRHHVSGLDASGLPLLVQDVRPIHDLLPVGVEHALGGERRRGQRDMDRYVEWVESESALKERG